MGETSSVVSDIKIGIAKCWLLSFLYVFIEPVLESRALAPARQAFCVSSVSFIFISFCGAGDRPQPCLWPGVLCHTTHTQLSGLCIPRVRSGGPGSCVPIPSVKVRG